MALRARPLDARDRGWLRRRLDERWGGPLQAYRGEVVDAAAADGLVAEDASGTVVGMLLWRDLPPTAGRAMDREIVLLEAFEPGRGVGSALLAAAEAAARAAGMAGLRATTTNDNTTALSFYQRHGLRLAELRPGAVDVARRALKPSIPVLGEHGIPIRDELDLLLNLTSD